MSDFIQWIKNRKGMDWFFFFLLLGPFLDVASFLANGETFSLSIVVRSIYLGILIILFLCKKKDLGSFSLLLGVGIILFSFSLFYHKDSLLSSASSVLKFLFLPLSLLYFRNASCDEKRNKVLEMILFTYLGIFVLSYFLGIGSDVYLETDGKTGFKGLFSSINEFSAITTSLLFYVSCKLNDEKKYFRLVLLFVLSVITSLLIGTKILFGGILFAGLTLLYRNRKTLFFDHSKTWKAVIVVGSLLILVGGGWFFTKTRIYQNMRIQQQFFEVNRVVSFDFLNRVIFNDRLTFLGTNYDYFRKQPFFMQLFGIGINEGNVKMVELDFFDLLFRYGIVGLSLFVYSLVRWIPWKKLELENKMALGLLLLISFLSGHVLFYPAVAIYFVPFSLLMGSSTERNLAKKRKKVE